jgi:2-O-(6-phospho-alpha-D-mannosyl)-D-glycerate hydrolase
VLRAHVVSHTHWDREWYLPFGRFRQRLVAIVDDLLDDPPLPDESFLLDGQAIILEDYLDVRPERAAELSSLLQSGRLEAGPWYVLADELIPSGEALIRNLLAGRRVLRRLRASSPPVLYCPDSFGHPAALPLIAGGFGLPLIILWRGFGGRRWPKADTVRWQAPDGESVVLYHLPPDGYEYGSALPTSQELANERWARMREVLSPRSALDVVLVPNGADHHARQRHHRKAIEALATAAGSTGDSASPSSLRAFADHVLQCVESSPLSRVTGELRDSYGYTWALQGTFASRAQQKRANAQVERALIRDAEPWSAFASLIHNRSRRELFDVAWRTLLQAHPHDTLCGCSIDAVARAMDVRLADALAEAIGLRDDAIRDLIGYDPVAARATGHAAWNPVVLVRNRTPRARRGVAIVELKQFIADVPVGPGSAQSRGVEYLEPTLPPLVARPPAQVLDTRVAYDRIESPQHYPDNDLVAVTRAAIWVDDVPPYGVLALPLGMVNEAEAPRPVRIDGTTMDNGLVRVSVSDSGRIGIDDIRSGDKIEDLAVLDDRFDRGDLYTPSIRGIAAVPRFLDAEVKSAGPLIGELRLRWLLLPQSPPRSNAVEQSELTLLLTLAAESPLLRFCVSGSNAMRDHRLRFGVRTRLANAAVWADAAFGPVHRLPLDTPEEDRVAESPPPTAPLHRYVSLFGASAGATLISDGLAEYEATADGNIFVTVLRAVGELSRNDLPERPGHAGWPTPTPEAQSLGRFGARFALLLHGTRSPETVHSIEQAADDVLLPLEGRTLRSTLSVPAPVHGLELHGRGLAFSTCKESEDGAFVVVRCVNLLDEMVEGAWTFGVAIRQAHRARLDETLLEPLAISDRRVEFQAPSRAVVTILVR